MQSYSIAVVIATVVIQTLNNNTRLMVSAVQDVDTYWPSVDSSEPFKQCCLYLFPHAGLEINYYLTLEMNKIINHNVKLLFQWELNRETGE